MQKILLILSALLLLNACNQTGTSIEKERKVLAEEFFRGVYDCNPSLVDSLASDDILISYPIFETLFGTPVLRGREAVRNFASGFCRKWTEAQFTFHEKIAEGNKVALVWSFSARNTGGINGEPPSNEIISWGGISVFSFNDQGKILSEVGEESEPGPFERITIRKQK